MAIDPVVGMLGSTILGGLFGGQPEADPYAQQLANQAKYWNKQGKGPMTQFQNYLYSLFQNPYGKEFQTQWNQTQQQLARAYQPLMQNLVFQQSQNSGAMPGDYDSVVPGIQAYVTRQWGQDLGDWLRNYMGTAQQNYGQQMFGNYSQLMGMGNQGLQAASQSYQNSQAQQGQGLQNLGYLLGQMYMTAANRGNSTGTTGQSGGQISGYDWARGLTGR